MNPEERLCLRLRELLSGKTARRDAEIKSDSLLVRDIGIGGDDAVEMFDELVGEFDLELEDFHYDDYFRTERELSSPLYYLKSILKLHRQINDLTVGELLKILTEALPNKNQPRG